MHRFFAFFALVAVSFALPIRHAPSDARSLTVETTRQISSPTLFDKRQEEVEDLELRARPFPPRRVDRALEFGATPFDKRQEDDEDLELGATPFSPRQVDPDLEHGGTPFEKRGDGDGDEDLERAGSPFEDITSRNVATVASITGT